MSKLNLLMQKTKDEISLHPFLFQILLPLFLIWFIFKWVSKPSKNSPPSPRGLPLIGNLHQIGFLPHQNLHAMAGKHGPVMLLHFGSLPTLIVSSAAAAAEILKTHDLSFADRHASRINRRLLYDCKDMSVAPYGEHWRQLKSVCVLHLLSTKRVQSFRHIREEETELLMEKIRESSGCLNLSTMFTQLANDVVCRSAFGKKYSVGENGARFFPLLREFLELLSTISIGDFIPWLSWMNMVNGFDKRVDKSAKDMDEFLEGVIRERLEASAEQVAADKRGENFLDILLEIYRNKSADSSIDRVRIKTIILDVFAGGTDTTSTLLEWAMTELLRHPQILKKLQTEVREVVKDKERITDDDIERMHYLKAVIKETLRRHPPIPMLVPRVAREDAKVMGYDVSVGTLVMVNAWAIGRDADSWEEPDKFYPDRFLNSSIDFKGFDFELIPFGAGRRGCPGMAFAMATNELVLANLVRKFDWELLEDGKDLDMSERPGLAIHKGTPLLAIGRQSL